MPTDHSALAARIRENIQRVIIGKSTAIDLALTALFSRRHVLLEDVPGTGKTMLAKALARSIDGEFRRIQFTPDLLPGDVTGQSIYLPGKGEFEFKAGPVFANIVLADEINRATPRSQAALLECMEEQQVTESGVTRRLRDPFFVIATQNPIEMQGTFPLPEAQLDRFFLRIRMGYPTTEESDALLSRFLDANPIEQLAPVATVDEVIAAQDRVGKIEVSQPMREYIIALCERTRRLDTVAMGASPRAMLALMRACQAWAMIRGRDFIVPEDVQELAISSLSHRLLLRNALSRSEQADEVVEEALRMTPVPTERIER